MAQAGQQSTSSLPAEGRPSRPHDAHARRLSTLSQSSLSALEAADMFSRASRGGGLSRQSSHDERREAAVVAVAKARVEAALRDLTASLGKAQADLASAGDALRRGPNSVHTADGPIGRGASGREPAEGTLGAGAELGCEGSDVLSLSRFDCMAGGSIVLGSHYGSEMLEEEEQSCLSRAHHASQVNAETLPDTWPSSLEMRLHAVLPVTDLSSQGDHRSLFSGGSLLSQLGRSGSSLQLGRSRNMMIATADGPRRKKWYVVHPNSLGRMIYDISGACFLMFDVLSIPLVVAWEIELEGFLLLAAWVTAVFWTLDIGMSFITATQRHGELVFDLRAIRKDYTKSWFVPDMVISLCDWLTLVVLSSTGWRLLRFAKLGRFLRLLAMFRLLKISRIIEEIVEVNMSDLGKLSMRFIKMFCLTLIYAHFIACIWFFIGRIGPSTTGVRWTDTEAIFGEDKLVFMEQTVGYQYTTSFHWAMSQITLGAMEIMCTTVFERLYTVVCLLTGLLFGSTLVSSLSATMLEAQMDKRESHEKMQKMRRYLRENRVDRVVAAQVERQLAERLATKEKLKQDQVVGLQQLSSFLRAQLQFEMFAPHLRSRPLFRLWISLDVPFVQTFCRECMSFRYLRTQDDLFTAGSAADYAYYFFQGRLTYTQEPESSPVRESDKREVEDHAWLAWPALWTLWTHVGHAIAAEYSEVAKVDVAATGEVMKRTATVIQLSYDYCKSYHRRLKAAKPPASSWPDDLQVPLTDWCDMVLAMGKDSQTIIGMDALRQATLGRKWKQSVHGLAGLTTEVQAGKSTVMLNAEGELERVVSMVAFKILDDTGQVLIQLGKQESGTMKPACQLPGGKQERGELITDTVERLLSSKLAPLASHVEIVHTEREVVTKESKEFGVKTKYLRNIISAKIAGDVEIQDVRIPAAVMSEAPSPERERSSDDHSQRESSKRRATGILGMGMGMSSMAMTRADSWANPALGHFRLWLSIQDRDAFLFPDNKGGAALCTWASEEEFDQMKSPECEELLQQEVARLMAHAEKVGIRVTGPDPAQSRASQ